MEYLYYNQAQTVSCEALTVCWLSQCEAQTVCWKNIDDAEHLGHQLCPMAIWLIGNCGSFLLWTLAENNRINIANPGKRKFWIWSLVSTEWTALLRLRILGWIIVSQGVSVYCTGLGQSLFSCVVTEANGYMCTRICTHTHTLHNLMLRILCFTILVCVWTYEYLHVYVWVYKGPRFFHSHSICWFCMT